MNYFIIVDLEATCWKQRQDRKNEAIEIGAVCLDSEQNIVDEFCRFIKP